MDPSSIRGIVAQVLSAGMWAFDLAGHPDVGSMLHDPSTAAAVTTLIASTFTLWGICEHVFVTLENKRAKGLINAISAGK